MTREQEDLLWKDLCTRLPYRVKFKVKYQDDTWRVLVIYKYGKIYVIGAGGYPIEVNLKDCQPYLFTLSSMTEEQKMFLKQQNWCIATSTSGTVETTVEGIDWLNKNHFDYRGLIEKGLEIDATTLNIYLAK